MFYNYLSIRSDSRRKKEFLVVDTQECVMDHVFVSHRLNAQVGKEYAGPGGVYCFVECSIRSRDMDEFLKAMEDLKAEMAKYGHHDYEAFCRSAKDRVVGFTKGRFLVPEDC